MDYSFLKIEQHDQITVMKVSAPKSLNALNSTVLKEIDDFVSNLDTKQTRVLIITGDGEKAFVAGADISEMVHLYEKEGCDGYLVKPVRGKTIEAELRRLLPAELISAESRAEGFSSDGTLIISGQRKKASVVITTSSVADIPEDFIKRYDISIIPLTIETEEGIFRDSVDIDSDGVLSYMVDEGREAHMNELRQDEYESFFK